MERRDPFRDLVALQGRMNELFDESLKGHQEEHSQRIWSPRVDIFETPEEVHIWLEIAGVEKRDLQIRADGNTLTVEGQRSLAPDISRDQYRLVERPIGRFSRTFTLPAGVDAGHIRANLKNGILQIAIARKAGGSTRQIEIESE